MKDKRFVLTDDYGGNFSLPINDSDIHTDELMITEVVFLLNELHEENQFKSKLIRKLIENE